MLEPNPAFRPPRTRDGYPPLEDLGLIGDGSTVALVGHDGNICCLCLPRFDSEPLLCGLLDRERGGQFSITPDGLTEARPNVLRFGLEPEDVTLHLNGIGAHAHSVVPLTLTARLDPPELPAYGRLLLDVLNGNAALSIRGDEAEEAWRVVEPVLAAWSNDLVPLQEYPAGSDGPGP